MGAVRKTAPAVWIGTMQKILKFLFASALLVPLRLRPASRAREHYRGRRASPASHRPHALRALGEGPAGRHLELADLSRAAHKRQTASAPGRLLCVQRSDA